MRHTLGRLGGLASLSVLLAGGCEKKETDEQTLPDVCHEMGFDLEGQLELHEDFAELSTAECAQMVLNVVGTIDGDVMIRSRVEVMGESVMTQLERDRELEVTRVAWPKRTENGTLRRDDSVDASLPATLYAAAHTYEHDRVINDFKRKSTSD